MQEPCYVKLAVFGLKQAGEGVPWFAVVFLSYFMLMLL